jgi:hypothetical protein
VVLSSSFISNAPLAPHQSSSSSSSSASLHPAARLLQASNQCYPYHYDENVHQSFASDASAVTAAAADAADDINIHDTTTTPRPRPPLPITHSHRHHHERLLRMAHNVDDNFSGDSFGDFL